jgi:hypothetical protein
VGTGGSRDSTYRHLAVPAYSQLQNNPIKKINYFGPFPVELPRNKYHGKQYQVKH